MKPPTQIRKSTLTGWRQHEWQITCQECQLTVTGAPTWEWAIYLATQHQKDHHKTNK